jgi:hypothetical protein
MGAAGVEKWFARAEIALKRKGRRGRGLPAGDAARAARRTSWHCINRFIYKVALRMLEKFWKIFLEQVNQAAQAA